MKIKKVLLLTDKDPDFGASFLYGGLALTLGPENVCENPIKPSYHQGFYPPGEYGAFGWLKMGHPVHNLEQRPRLDYDAVILENTRVLQRDNEFILCFLDKVRQTGKPIIIHDGEDGPYFMDDQLRLCDFYLKRELAIPHDNKKVIHFPFSCPDQIVKSPKQWREDRAKADIDVLFLMGDSHPMRRQMYYAIKEWQKSPDCKLKWEARLLGSVDPALSYEEYTALIDRSKFAISMRGGGEDTVRFWEILGRTGLIHDWPQLQVTGWGMGFCMGGYRDVPILSPMGIEALLTDPARLAAIEHLCRKGHAKISQHTNSARVKAMLQEVEERWGK